MLGQLLIALVILTFIIKYCVAFYASVKTFLLDCIAETALSAHSDA